MDAKLPMLALAMLAGSAGTVTGQTVYAAPDVIYETHMLSPAARASTPSDVTVTAPMPIDAVQNPASQVSRPLDSGRPRADAPPQANKGAAFGLHPFLAMSRCVTDLGYGRWESCD